ncbi:MAG: glycosyltransferase [Bacteroidota bacterium]
MGVLPNFGDPQEFWMSLVFFALVFIQLFWLVFFYLRLAGHQHKSGGNLPPVSILIAARNEEDNLFEFLPFVLEQDYYAFEVIVINDQSADDTAHILKALQRRYNHLKVINLEQNKHFSQGKKLPLTVGIKGAKYDHLLFTDADCKPNSPQWIQKMGHCFTSKKALVLGYGPYRKKSGLLNWFARLDTAIIAMNYLSYAKAGVPYMGVGRNMAYTKKLFFDNDGFKSHYALASGDDDLFVQEVANRKNTKICIQPESFCYSDAPDSWKDWIKQKSRHYTTSERYGLFNKVLLGIYPLTLLLTYASFITLLIKFDSNILVLSLFAVVVLLKWIIFGVILRKLRAADFAWGIIIWDLIYAIVTPIIYYTTDKKSTTTQWK